MELTEHTGSVWRYATEHTWREGAKVLRTAAAVIGAILASIGIPTVAHASHSAGVGTAIDPIFSPYSGTTNPSGTFQINLAGGLPGYLNGVTGGQDGGAAGGIIIQRVPQAIFTVGVAIHVTDSAGASHSLSALNDPSLGDIVADLTLGSGGAFPVTAYAYNSAPSQYSAAELALGTGEAANGGQPFDILLAGVDNFPPGRNEFIWNFWFSNEVGNLDGISALSVTDVGAVPEPAAATALFTCVLLLIQRRPRAAS
jgi:hypothetical protein